MGYCISMTIEGIYIPAKNVQKCLEAINKMFKLGKRFGWVDPPPPTGYDSLEHAFRSWRYAGHIDKTKDFVIDCFEGEKLGDDRLFWSTIAPFVNQDGVIRVRGEDGYHWRWVFANGKLKEQKGRIVYDDQDSCN